MNSKIQAAEENLIHVYNRFPIALDHGKGMYLYDTDGKEYLDFAAGFAVTGLGYDNKELNEALKKQIDKLYHTSNLYYHESCGEAAEALNKVSGMDRVFFTKQPIFVDYSQKFTCQNSIKQRKPAYTKDSNCQKAYRI